LLSSTSLEKICRHSKWPWWSLKHPCCVSPRRVFSKGVQGFFFGWRTSVESASLTWWMASSFRPPSATYLGHVQTPLSVWWP
jgi:hypothetical protein